MITVLLVYFETNRSNLLPEGSQDVFSPIWVDKVIRGVKRNTTLEVNFACLTDRKAEDFEEEVECIPFLRPERNWMTLLEIFRPDLERLGRVFFMGLDTVIVGSLDEVFGYRGAFGLVRNPFKRYPPGYDDYTFADMCNAVVSFDAGATLPSRLWRRYLANPDFWEKEYRLPCQGCGCEMLFIYWQLNATADALDELFPGQMLHHEFPQDAKNVRMVYFSGGIKPHTVGDAWIKKEWV